MQPLGPNRPVITAMRHVVSAGHHFAAQAGFQILEAGGNAIDAGVAAGMALSVLEPSVVGFGGVAPIIIYLADRQQVVTISGLGRWPRLVTPDYFVKRHGGQIPEGVERTVVPAAPDAWITALEHYGTMSFGEVAAASARFARDGFPMYPRLAGFISRAAEKFRNWPGSAAHFLPNDRMPLVGEVFRQPDLAKTIQYMIDQEAGARSGGRAVGLQAARDAFYRGDIADIMVRYHIEHGGLLRHEDLAAYRSKIENPVRSTFDGADIYACGPWCQGPMLLQILNILKGRDLAGLGHNSVAYVHLLTEAIKLAAADRDAYYADPEFIDVPMDVLLSEPYAASRRLLLRDDLAWPEMPPAGAAGGPAWPHDSSKLEASTAPLETNGSAFDTSYVCVMDRAGNAFSATPSDSALGSPVIPGLGFVPSVRGVQSRGDPAHIASVAPGKRPRLTPSPAIAIHQRRYVMPFGTPEGDVQPQSMLQTFFNIHVFGMDPQTAVEAPRFASFSFPSWFAPYDYYPGRLNLEARFPQEVAEGLALLGHKIDWWPDRTDLAGSMCVIRRDEVSGVMEGGADNRRFAYAIGW